MNYFVDIDKQPHSRKVPAFHSGTRFEIDSVSISFYRLRLLDRIFVPFLRYFVNRSARTGLLRVAPELAVSGCRDPLQKAPVQAVAA
jgi:hypothetical protein